MSDEVKALIRQAIQTLTVPAAEYVPAIPDAWAILQRALDSLVAHDGAMSTDTLKPCPWCGGRALAYDVRETHGICTVECTGCNADRSGDTPELAALAWNHRASPSPAMSTDCELTGDVGRLAELMSDISEDCWCAGWMSCNEFSLWQMVIDPTTERRYGLGHVTDDQVAELKALSERTGGWVIWWDDFSGPAAPVETWGERFISMAEWQTLWAEWEGRAAASMTSQEKAK